MHLLFYVCLLFFLVSTQGFHASQFGEDCGSFLLGGEVAHELEYVVLGHDVASEGLEFDLFIFRQKLNPVLDVITSIQEVFDEQQRFNLIG